MSATAIALLAACSALGALMQALTGFGGALVLAPVLFATLRPSQAILVNALVGLAQGTVMLLAGRRHVRPPEVRRLLAAALPGLVAGALVLRVAPAAALQVAVGVSVLAAVAARALRPPRGRPGLRAALPVGFLAGGLTTSVSINGPPLVLYLAARGLTPAQMRATLAAVFLSVDAVTVPALAVTGTLSAPPAAALATLALAFPAGLALGLRLGPRVSGRAYARAVTIVLVGLALASIAAGVR